jgi:group I intron endonuclease
MREKLRGVYAIENTETSSCYIGSSVDIEKRFAQHQSRLRNRKHCNKHLQRAFDKYGETAFSLRVLEKTAEHLQREQHFINTLKPAYNMAPVAGSLAGYKHSKETLERMSAAKRGAKHPMFGKHLSEEAREKQRNADRSKHYISKEARKRMSDARIKRPVARISSSGELVEYPSVKAAARDGFAQPNVQACCAGRRKSHGGYQWRYTTPTAKA